MDDPDNFCPLPEGRLARPPLEADAGAGSVPLLALSARTTLADLAGEWVAFHHGILLSYGRFPFDPVQHFLNQEERPVEVARIAFDVPLFDDYADPPGTAWGRTICLTRADAWPALQRFVGQAAVLDRDRGLLARSWPATVRLPDPLALARGRLRWLDLPYFGLVGSDRWVYLAMPPGRPRPALRVQATSPEARLLAGRVLDESDPNPYAVLDPFYHRKSHGQGPP